MKQPCKTCGKKATHRTLKLCTLHFKEHRKAQMAPVIAKWQARVKAGKVKPKFVYKGRPTESALAKPARARAYFAKRKGGERLAKLLDAALAKQDEQKQAA